MSKRAVLYARISGDDRKNATSGVDGQLEECRKYATEKGYLIVEEFFEERDKHTSGADWLPELNKIIQLASKNKFDVLIVRELDRLARNRFKQMSVEIELGRHNISVEYAKGQYADTPEGRLLKGLMGEFAEFEREKIKERMVGGTLRSIKKGNIKVSNNPPYGYKVVKKNGLRVLAIVDEEANVVRLIFDLYANQNYTIYAIAKYLNENNIAKPRSTKRGWSHGALHNILKNESYIGNWYYRKTKWVKSLKSGKPISIPRPKNEWLLVKVPPIVSTSIFQRVQKRREENKRQNKQRKNTYALGGMLTCGHCGNGMSGITWKDKSGKQTYVCNLKHGKGRYEYAQPCNSPYYKVHEVDNAVWQWLKSILLSPERLRTELEKYQQLKAVEFKPLLDILKSSESKLSELLQEKERLIKAYTAGILSLDEIAIQKLDIDKRIENLTQSVDQLKVELKTKLLSEEEQQSIEEIAMQVREGADFTDDSQKTQREIYKLIHMHVTLNTTDGQKWADVSCMFGKKRLPAAYTANDSGYP